MSIWWGAAVVLTVALVGVGSPARARPIVFTVPLVVAPLSFVGMTAFLRLRGEEL